MPFVRFRSLCLRGFSLDNALSCSKVRVLCGVVPMVSEIACIEGGREVVGFR